MKRRFKLTVVALFVFLPAGTFVRHAVAAWQETPAEKVFKNIQALKGVPARLITPLMAGYNKALGVECDYCHTMDALEKADKPAHKASVRDIQMTREINDRYKMKVDCVNCHQGRAKPSGVGSATAGTTTPTTSPTTTPGGGKEKPPATQPAKQTEPPGMVSFAASYGNVAFPHDKHMDIGDCTTCHHTNKDVTSETVQKCSACHMKTPGSLTRITAKDVAHGTKSPRNCTGCHISSKAGPTKCGECHKR
jgi:Class III cytochrome C family